MKLAYGIVGLVGAIAAVVVGTLGMPNVMVVTALLAAGLLFAANTDRIARVKAGAAGFEAETRAMIEEARATLEQVRSVAKIAVQANLSLVMRAGRMGGFSFDEKERIRKAGLGALELLQVSRKEMEEMFSEWHSVNRFDYVHIILGRYMIPEEIRENPELVAEWKKLRGGGFAGNPPSDVVEAFLLKAGMMTQERRELLIDYRHYEKHSEHRRPEVWKKLHDRET